MRGIDATVAALADLEAQIDVGMIDWSIYLIEILRSRRRDLLRIARHAALSSDTSRTLCASPMLAVVLRGYA